MAMITDVDYILQAIRLSSLRATDDPISARVISLDPSFALNPYINASGLSDVDRWPEMKRALDSPPLEPTYLPDDASRTDGSRTGGGGGGGLKYTQTIMGPGRTGGAGMRVSGRTAQPGENRRGPAGRTQRAGSAASITGTSLSPKIEKTPTMQQPTMDNGFFSPSGRPRADSAPAMNLLGLPPGGLASSILAGTSMLTTGRGLGVDAGAGLLERALSTSETSGGALDVPMIATPGMTYDVEDSSIGPGGQSDLAVTTVEVDRLAGAVADEGSDVDEDEEIDDDGQKVKPMIPPVAVVIPSSRRVSADSTDLVELDFAPISVGSTAPAPRASALTAALNRHIPHLVSTSTSDPSISTSPSASTGANPFFSLYASVAAPPSAPSLSLEIYFPHSKKPSAPIVAKVRKDATVEEVTGFGLWKFWEEGREPLMSAEDQNKWSSVGWGLRIVEDDGEVDEDFPPLDRDSSVSKFSYGQFAIVEASEAQIRQNAAKFPMIHRRPSRVLGAPLPPRSTIPAQAVPSRNNALAPPGGVAGPGAGVAASSSYSSSDHTPVGSFGNPGLSSTAMKGSVGLSSSGSDIVRLKVRVTASADVHFTTTINVPSDMYIADLTEVLCKKKRLQMPVNDWVLCLADLTLALPLDRTVASLEGRTELALVKRQWAVEHGLRIDDRRGGDPSASIFKRKSEPAPIQRFGPGLADFAQTYKKYIVQRKIAIGRHERVLAIDGDYIHIMPSESRAFFDSMKTTSFHVTLVASCKLTSRAGGFKINVWRDGTLKRYEFDAENQRQAERLLIQLGTVADIVNTVRQLMKSYSAERTIVPPNRPSSRK